MNPFVLLLRSRIRTFVILLLLGASPLQAFALQCQVRCALASPTMPVAMQIDAATDAVILDRVADPDCHTAVDTTDDCAAGAHCAAAHAVALPATGTAHCPAGIVRVSAQAAPDRISHTPIPPERPPRRG